MRLPSFFPGPLAPFIALALVLAAGAARAADVPCGPVEPDNIRIDGLLEDWGDVQGLEMGDGGPDFSFVARCNYDRDTLYLVIDVRDDYLVRSRQARPVEDHVEIAFADGPRVDRLIIFPGDASGKRPIPRSVRWSSGHKLKGIEVADGLQPKGWAVEMRMALASVPGYGAGSTSIRLAVAAFDCDSKASPAVKATLRTSPIDDPRALGVIEFAEARAALESFLRQRGLQAKDVRFDQIGRVFASGTGRAVVAGRTLAVIGEEYAYIDLPATSPADLLEIRLVDLAGDGHDAILVRYRESSRSGAREVLALYRMTGEGLRRTFGVEVAKTDGKNRLESKILYVKRKSATDIVLEAQPAVGWTEASYRESPDEELVPMLLPWAKERRQRYQFRGEEYSRAE